MGKWKYLEILSQDFQNSLDSKRKIGKNIKRIKNVLETAKWDNTLLNSDYQAIVTKGNKLISYLETIKAIGIFE